MVSRIRKKEGEDLSDSQVEKVFNLLNTDSPITKKKACELLKIAYNPSRLDNILQGYTTRRNFSIKRRKELRNTVLSEDDISYIISAYLDNESISDISNFTYRSSGIIRRTLQKYNIPLRNASISYFNPIFLSEDTISEKYSKHDLVYSARYTQPAKINNLYKNDKYYGNIYRIWLIHDQQYAYQPYYELGDLTKIQTKFKVDIKDLTWTEDIAPEINKTLANAKKKVSKSK